jgi:hypothetical protein
MSDSEPELLLVEKHRLGDRPEDIHEIPGEKAKLISEAVSEDGNVSAGHPKYQQFLKQIHENEYWIGCTCREGDRPFVEAPVPLITVQKREDYVLLRLPQRPAHVKGCPLEGDRAKSDPTRREGEKIKDRGVCFHRRPTQRTETREETEETEYKTQLPAKRSTMERALYTLLDESGLTESEGETHQRGSAFGKVADAASEIPLASNFRLKDYLWVSPWKVGEAAKYIRKDWDKWSGGSRPHGVFVFQAETLEEKTIIYDQSRYDESDSGAGSHQIQDKVEMRAPDTSGPHIFLMTFADSEENPKWFEPRKAFGIPVVEDGHYFPVESEQERAIARSLLDRIENLNEEEERPFRLYKPLFNSVTSLGDVRANLVLRWLGESVQVRLTTSQDVYKGEEGSVEETLDYQKLAELGRPVVIGTKGSSGWGIIDKVCDRLDDEIETIAQLSGRQSAPVLS